MKNYNYVKTEIALAGVKVGDKLSITPLDTLPNFDREIVVDSINENSFGYGSTETSDGREYPFWAIKKFKVIKEI